VNLAGFRMLDRANILRLKAAVSSYLDAGRSNIARPWPSPDIVEPSGAAIWFSPERTIERTKLIFLGALDGYIRIVESWFPQFRERLNTAILMPVRVEGTVVQGLGGPAFGHPRIWWHMRPLAGQVANEVVLRNANRLPELDDDGLARLDREARRLRPNAQAWLSVSDHFESMNAFEQAPATALCYRWLEADLRMLDWL
jgi:hypothetical protein